MACLTCKKAPCTKPCQTQFNSITFGENAVPKHSLNIKLFQYFNMAYLFYSPCTASLHISGDLTSLDCYHGPSDVHPSVSPLLHMLNTSLVAVWTHLRLYSHFWFFFSLSHWSHRPCRKGGLSPLSHWWNDSVWNACVAWLWQICCR